MATRSSQPSSSTSHASKQSRSTFLGLRLPQTTSSRKVTPPEDDASTTSSRGTDKRFPLPLPYSATVELDRIMGDTRSASGTKSRGGQMPYIGQDGRLWRDRDEELEYAALLRDNGGSSAPPSDDELMDAARRKGKPFANTHRGSDRRDVLYVPSENRSKNVHHRNSLPAGFSAPFQVADTIPSPLHHVREPTSSQGRFNTAPAIMSGGQLPAPPVFYPQDNVQKATSPRHRRLDPLPDLSLSNPSFMPPPPSSTRGRVDLFDSSFSPGRFTSEFSPVTNDQESFSA